MSFRLDSYIILHAVSCGISDAHIIFGLSFYLIFHPRYAAPLSGHPVFSQAAKNAQRNAHNKNEIPQALAVVTEHRHESRHDFCRSAAQHGADKESSLPLDTVLGRVNPP